MKKCMLLIPLLLSGCVPSQEQLLKEQEEKAKNAPQQMTFDDHSLLDAFFMNAAVVNVPAHSGVIELVVAKEAGGKSQEIMKLDVKVNDDKATVAIGIDEIQGQKYIKAAIQTENGSVNQMKLLEIKKGINEFTRQWDEHNETFAVWELFDNGNAQHPSETYKFKVYLK